MSRAPSARQPVFEMVNGEPAFTRAWYLYLSGEPEDTHDSEILDLQQAPTPVDMTAPWGPQADGLSQLPTYEELRSQVTEMQKQLDALAQVPK